MAQRIREPGKGGLLVNASTEERSVKDDRMITPCFLCVLATLLAVLCSMLLTAFLLPPQSEDTAEMISWYMCLRNKYKNMRKRMPPGCPEVDAQKAKFKAKKLDESPVASSETRFRRQMPNEWLRSWSYHFSSVSEGVTYSQKW
ncbi:hypothetical protein MTO96_023076 [Rhipicephalus appendiculatus]